LLRFAAWLKRSPDTATPDEVRGFQLTLPLTSFQFPSTLFQSMAQSSRCENLATPQSALGFLAVA
jgi:hypothetical protein